MNHRLKKFSRNCCVLFFNLPELGYTTASLLRKLSSLAATNHHLPRNRLRTVCIFFKHRLRTACQPPIPYDLYPLDCPTFTQEQTTNSLYIHRTQATNSLSTPRRALRHLPVGTTNTAGLDLTIGKRFEGTADDCGTRTDCRTKNGPPLPQPGNNNNNNPKQQQKPRTTTTTPNNNNNPQQQTPTTNPNNNPNKGSPTGQNPRTPDPLGLVKSPGGVGLYVKRRFKI